MDLESIGGGLGGGILIGILTALGINRRVGRIEDYKQDKTVCEAIHKGSEQRLERIENKLDRLGD